MNNIIYCAIIGKILNLNDKINTTAIIEEVLIDINKKYKTSIESDMNMTENDECQGILKDISFSYHIVREIQKKIAPFEIVFGIGIDTMEKTFFQEIKIELAIFRARQMVERAKKKKPSICYYLRSGEHELINSLIMFIETCRCRRSNKQNQISELYEELGTQKKVAQTLNIAQSTVSEQLKRAFYKEVSVAEEKILEYFFNT